MIRTVDASQANEAASAKNAEWTPVRRVNLSEDIADQLISRILQGKLKFGEKLPPERDLARLLDVGRPTIREAIRTLSVIGLVEVRPGEGTFIVEHHAEFVAKAFSWTLLLDARTAVELIDVRTAVECQQARVAARVATNEDVTRLNEILERMKKTTDPDPFFHVDFEFHGAISSIAGNVALERLMVASRSLLRQWIQIAGLAGRNQIPRLVREHRQIAAAIAARDEDAADTAMRKHVEAVGRMIADAAQAGTPPELTDSAQRGRLERWPWEGIR
jgi:GntR family transcriptional repressor for pyruvate dehydrogenase complex